ncbi:MULTISPECIES: hypothetical protein [unclassified Microcoleus]|uniref:hypothetical protein n=1 Tax=unclassified Microcoleus TaxID=2642155 RepID=UPI0025DE890A|nr:MULTISPECIES: hypothetical protein [unclassified Microcoleus]
MNSKKIWAIWTVFLILLTGCEEIHGVISFKKNGSGTLSLRIVNSESPNESSQVNVETCRKLLTSIAWDNVSHERIRSTNNSSGSDQCAYTYSFNDLDEVEKLYKGLGLKLNRLTINNDEFTYKSTDKTCVNDFDLKFTKSVTWSIEPPGNIKLHNADKVIGDKLIWNISGSDCYDISVVSGIASPLERLPEPSTTPEQATSRVPASPISSEKSELKGLTGLEIVVITLFLIAALSIVAIVVRRTVIHQNGLGDNSAGDKVMGDKTNNK